MAEKKVPRVCGPGGEGPLLFLEKKKKWPRQLVGLFGLAAWGKGIETDLELWISFGKA